MNNFTGLNESSINEIQKILRQGLNAKSHFKVSVFGSRAKNTYKKYSDLDLWIDCVPELSSKEISDLHQLFEDSNLAINIDIVTPETCLPAYKQQILSEIKFFFESSK